MSMNAFDTAATISVEQFWGAVRLPWGTLTMGARAFPLGVGATFGTNTRTDMFLLEVPYGPFRFSYALWPSRSRLVEGWANVPDISTKNEFFQGLIFACDNGNMSLGTAIILRRFLGEANTQIITNQQDNTLSNLIYFKYFNGSLFANVEYSWVNIDRYRTTAENPLGSALGTQAQIVFMEGYHFFSEIGAVVGPAKLSLMYALASGSVLNNANRLRNVNAGGFFLGPTTPAPFSPGRNPKVCRW